MYKTNIECYVTITECRQEAINDIANVANNRYIRELAINVYDECIKRGFGDEMAQEHAMRTVALLDKGALS